MAKIGKKTRILIEILIILFVIAGLMVVFLISIRTVPDGRDRWIISAISEIRIEAEIYFDNQPVPTYIGLDADKNVIAAKNDVDAHGGEVKSLLSQTNYVIWSKLPSNPKAWYCIDATGWACKLNVEPASNASKCGCPNEP